MRVFLIGDAVGCPLVGHKPLEGWYRCDRMIESAVRNGADVGCCGGCLDARGITEELLTIGTNRSSLEELAAWPLCTTKVVSF